MNVVINKASLYYEVHGRGEPLLRLQGCWIIGAPGERKLHLASTPPASSLAMPLRCSIIFT
jgi:hypothetical protein